MIEEILIININRNPWQPRMRFDEGEIAELAEKIEKQGLIQFPVGRRRNGSVELAVGERRLLAYKHNHMTSIPVDIRELTDEEMAEFAMSENMDRVDLSRIEIANGLKKWADDFGWSHEAIAEKLGKSREWVTNTLRLLELPEDVKEKVNDGTISARQGEAVLAITKLPESVVERAKENGYDPNDDLEKAKTGEWTSDKIRDEANWYVRQYTEKTADAIFPTSVAFGDAENFLCPTCDLCEHRIKHGSEMRCPEKECWDAKSAAWENIVLEEASAASGIPILELEEGENRWQSVLSFTHSDYTLGEDGIFAEGCENLRLVFDDQPQAPEALDLEKHPQVAIVCHHGTEGPRCPCSRKRNQEAQKVAKEKELQDPEKQAHKERKQQLEAQVVTPAVEALDEAIAELTPAAWLMVYRKIAHTSGGEKWTVEQIRQRIARKLVEKALPYWEPENNLPAAQTEIVKKILEPIGRGELFETDEEADPVPQLEKRLERIRGWVDSLSLDYPTPDVVQGNIVNLDTLLWDVEQIALDHPGDKRIDALCLDIDFEREKLRALLPVVEIELAEPLDMETVCALVGLELIDDSLEELIQEAGHEEIKYALALLTGDEERTEVLQKALSA